MATAAFDTQGYDQAKTRQYMRYTDQHGRVWGASIDVKSMAPVGTWEAIQPRRIPLRPPSKFIRVVPGEFGRVRIDYDGWERELRDAHAMWDRLLRENAYQKYGDKAGEAIENRPPALLQLVGPEPPAVEPVILAREGQRWLLGFDDGPMPQPLRRFFPEPEQPEVVDDLSPELAALLEDGDVQRATQANGNGRTATSEGDAPYDYPARLRYAKETLGLEFAKNPKKAALERAIRAAEAEGRAPAPEPDTAAVPAGGRDPSWG